MVLDETDEVFENPHDATSRLSNLIIADEDEDQMTLALQKDDYVWCAIGCRLI